MSFSVLADHIATDSILTDEQVEQLAACSLGRPAGSYGSLYAEAGCRRAHGEPTAARVCRFSAVLASSGTAGRPLELSRQKPAQLAEVCRLVTHLRGERPS
ncbi:hypothetical protein [Streptomyces sp. NPDC002205]|uniref:hypothetical protein n=1 Tax=Streptomyces sp. NPDC002205 TaxID=3154411 RepID=UPI003324D9B0